MNVRLRQAGCQAAETLTGSKGPRVCQNPAVCYAWGASYPVAKGALAHAPVLLLIFYRFAITASILSSPA